MPTPQAPPPPPPNPQIRVTNSTDTLGPNTQICMMVWGPSGYGKTHLTGQLEELTQKYKGKKTLYIPLEVRDGGGAATLRKLGVDIFEPKDYTDLTRTLGYLRNDRTYGGVVLDSGTELVKIYIKPNALKYPCRENVATRVEGVATRSDYQVMGEMVSGFFRNLILLTKHENPDYRKHLILTAADASREDESGRVEWQGPDLPGRMSREAVQMFQQVGTLVLKPKVVEGKRVVYRYLTFVGDGVKAIKDPYDIFPPEIQIAKEGGGEGETLTTMYEKYWLPEVARRQAAQTTAQ